MNKSTLHGFSRREFLAGTSTLGAASLARASASRPRLSRRPRQPRVRLAAAPAICHRARCVLAEELLRLEGFTEVQYVDSLAELGPNLVAAGRADFTQWDVSAMIPMLDAGAPTLILAGRSPRLPGAVRQRAGPRGARPEG